MAVENAQYITELVEANPNKNDPIAQGDEHIRLIKHVLTETFPRLTGLRQAWLTPCSKRARSLPTMLARARDQQRPDQPGGRHHRRNLTASQNVISQSDERLKTKHSTIDDALDKVKTLDTFTYLPNERGVECGMPYVEQAGVSAQQVQAVFPQAVQQTDNGYLAVDYARLCVLLLEAVKELSHKIENQA